MSTGDDLAQARRFSDLCQETMSSLMKSAHQFPTDTVLMLETIQSQAKHIQARAISRTARLAIDDLTTAKAEARSAGSLLALNKLICQYTDGLDEIAPQDMTAPENREVFQEKLQALLILQDAEMRAAQDTVQSLLFLAKPGRERNALGALARLSRFGSDDREARPSDQFDVIMPSVTNESLRNARLAKKSVSVSYASDDIFMDPPMTQALQSAVITVCAGLVDRCVEAPLRRKNLGLSGAAHIAITARRSGAVFNVLITCEGPAPSQSLLSETSISALQKYGAKIDISQYKGLTRIEMTNLPIADSKTLPERGRDKAISRFRPHMEMRA